jgi:hypothetical protein
MYAVNWADVPDPSERTTGMIAWSGSASPGFSARIESSFHFFKLPVKILATVVPSSRNVVIGFPDASRRLYISDVPPATIGRYV